LEINAANDEELLKTTAGNSGLRFFIFGGRQRINHRAADSISRAALILLKTQAIKAF